MPDAGSVKSVKEHSSPSHGSPSESKISVARTISIHETDQTHLGVEEGLSAVASHQSIGHPISRPTTTRASTVTNDPNFEIDWEEDDPKNPINWPTWYKGLTIAAVSWGTFVVVVYSTSYTTGFSGMMDEFHVRSEPIVTLGITSYCR